MKIKDNLEHIYNSAGQYIRFCGGVFHKNEFYEIIGERKWTTTQTGGLLLRKYNARKLCYLPSYEFNKEFEIIDKKEFVKLPK